MRADDHGRHSQLRPKGGLCLPSGVEQDEVNAAGNQRPVPPLAHQQALSTGIWCEMSAMSASWGFSPVCVTATTVTQAVSQPEQAFERVCPRWKASARKRERVQAGPPRKSSGASFLPRITLILLLYSSTVTHLHGALRVSGRCVEVDFPEDHKECLSSYLSR